MQPNKPQAIQERDRAAWREIYDPAARTPIWHALPFMSDLLTWFRKAGCYKILDGACGDGGQMIAVPEEFLVVGLDQSPEAIECANRHLLDRKKRNFMLTVGRLEQMPFPRDSFDGAMLIDILSSFLDPVPVLAELRRVLKGDATLIITTFSKSDPCGSGLEHLDGDCGVYADKFVTLLYSEESVTHLVRSAGFDVVECLERSDPEAPHPGYREESHTHNRLVLVARTTQ